MSNDVQLGNTGINVVDIHELINRLPENAKAKSIHELIDDAFQRGQNYSYAKFRTAISAYEGRVCDDCCGTEFKDYNGHSLDACIFCGQLKEKE